jgi:hypothetical protein
MAVPLDQQFRIEKKGIMEERIPVLVNFIKYLFSLYPLLSM